MSAYQPYSPPSGNYQPTPVYGPPQPMMVMRPPDHPQATVVLVLGILSIVGVSVCGPIAWYLSNKALAEIEANPGRYNPGGALISAG
jgi:hypothetical protein